MRKFLALFVALAAVLAACGSPTATTDNPYELVQNARSATWDRVQVDIGIDASGGTQTFSIDPSALRFAVDTTTKKVNVHIAFPIAALGDSASELRAIGIIGDTIEFDVIYDGAALYAKSATLGNLFAALLIQSGEIPSGDMTGWLQLLTKADIDSLGSLGGGLSPVPIPSSFPIPSDADAATLQAKLEDMGITLTYAGSASRNGVDADHVTVAVDLAKLAASDYMSGLGSDGLTVDPNEGTISGDLWFDRSAGRLIGVDVHIASTADPPEMADVTINIHEPDAGVSFDAPDTFVEVPLMDMISSMMGGFGSGLFQQ